MDDLAPTGSDSCLIPCGEIINSHQTLLKYPTSPVMLEGDEMNELGGAHRVRLVLMKSIFGLASGIAKSRAFLLGLVAVTSLAAGTDGAQAVSVSASTSAATVGQSFDVAVNIDAGEAVGAVQLLFDYGSPTVAASSSAAGSVFAGLTAGSDFAIISSSISPTDYGLTVLFLVDQIGPDSIVEFVFTALSAGIANFQVSGQISSSVGGVTPFSSSTAVNILDSSITPAIPLPASGLLLVCGAMGLITLRRKS